MKRWGYIEKLDEIPASDLIELVTFIKVVEADTDLAWDHRNKLLELIIEKIRDGAIQRLQVNAKVGRR